MTTDREGPPSSQPASPLPFRMGQASVLLGADGIAIGTIDCLYSEEDAEYIVAACNAYPSLRATTEAQAQRERVLLERIENLTVEACMGEQAISYVKSGANAWRDGIDWEAAAITMREVLERDGITLEESRHLRALTPVSPMEKHEHGVSDYDPTTADARLHALHHTSGVSHTHTTDFYGTPVSPEEK